MRRKTTTRLMTVGGAGAVFVFTFWQEVIGANIPPGYQLVYWLGLLAFGLGVIVWMLEGQQS